MRYCVYHVTTDGTNQARMDHVWGKTEDQCWKRAVREYGRENIYGFTRSE